MVVNKQETSLNEQNNLQQNSSSQLKNDQSNGIANNSSPQQQIKQDDSGKVAEKDALEVQK